MPHLMERTRRVAVLGSLLAVVVALPGGSLVTTASAQSEQPTTRAASASATAATVVRNRCKRSSVGAPRCGVLWGSYLSPQPTSGVWRQPYGALEGRVGRRFDIVKYYQSWDPTHLFPNTRQKRLARGTGRIWEVSWSAYRFSSGRHISYQDVADGVYDATVVRPQARALKRWGHRVILDFDHEMEGKRPRGGTGTAKQYRAAYRHLVRVFRSVGASNVKWAWVPMGWTPSKFARYYPGRRYVDWVGWDPYNFYTCTGARWKSPLATFRPFYRWARQHAGTRHKPLLLGEYATVNGPGARQWYRRVHTALRRLPRIKAVIQFGSQTSARCDFDLRSSTSSLRGFRVSGRAADTLGRR